MTFNPLIEAVASDRRFSRGASGERIASALHEVVAPKSPAPLAVGTEK
jgi:hypothetical protein